MIKMKKAIIQNSTQLVRCCKTCKPEGRRGDKQIRVFTKGRRYELKAEGQNDKNTGYK